MSNPCFTTYMVTGRRQDVESLHGTLQRMQSDRAPLVENGCCEANMLLGCLVKALGGEPEDVICRGYVTGFSMLGDGTLSINIQTAWNEYPELRHFIESRFEGMKIFYFEDACEDDILNTNDLEGRFFKTRVFIDSEDYFGEEDNYGNFETFEEAAKAVSAIVGHEVEPNGQAMETALEDYMEENPDAYFSYHEVQVVDD